MAEVVFAGVSKRYGEVVAVEDLSLTVADRELMVLVGPSGCGKSTALRMIAGLEGVTAGTVAIGGRVVNDLPPRERDIAMVFQSYALYPHMTVRGNLEYGLKMRRVPREERRRRVHAAAATLGLEGLLERRPKELSGGQRQRVAVGRAIVREPAVFLFDEPLSNLDAKLRMQMRAEIVRLQQRLAATAVYVTHDQVEAMTMGSRIAVMKEGRLQQVGPPLEVYRRPANVFVAGFIGALPMNLLPARMTGEGALAAEGFEVALPPRWRQGVGVEAGRELVVGFRPERLAEAAAERRPGWARAAAEVELAEPLGDEVVVHARLGEHLLVAKLGPQRVPPPGSRIELELDPEGVHLFDATTGRRLEEQAPA